MYIAFFEIFLIQLELREIIFVHIFKDMTPCGKFMVANVNVCAKAHTKKLLDKSIKI